MKKSYWKTHKDKRGEIEFLQRQIVEMQREIERLTVINAKQEEEIEFLSQFV